MHPNEHLIAIHQAVIIHKEHLVVEHGEYHMPPLLAVTWDDSSMHQVDMALCFNKLYEETSHLPRDVVRWILSPASVLKGVLEMLATKTWEVFPTVDAGICHTPATAAINGVWLALEQFRDPRPYDDIEAVPITGVLQHDFETNPDSPVLEAITTYVVETGVDGLAEWARMTTCHRRVEGGGLEWLETETRRSDTDPLVDPECDTVIDVMCQYVTRESLA